VIYGSPAVAAVAVADIWNRGRIALGEKFHRPFPFPFPFPFPRPPPPSSSSRCPSRSAIAVARTPRLGPDLAPSYLNNAAEGWGGARRPRALPNAPARM